MRVNKRQMHRRAAPQDNYLVLIFSSISILQFLHSHVSGTNTPYHDWSELDLGMTWPVYPMLPSLGPHASCWRSNQTKYISPEYQIGLLKSSIRLSPYPASFKIVPHFQVAFQIKIHINPYVTCILKFSLISLTVSLINMQFEDLPFYP